MNRKLSWTILGVLFLTIAAYPGHGREPAAFLEGPTQIYGINGTTRADVTGSNALKVDPSAVTSPVSAASLPLPTGAATSSLQTSGNTSLASLVTLLNGGLPAALDSGALKVAIENSPTVVVSSSAPASTFFNQVKVASTGTAVQVASSQAINQGVTLYASPANSAPLYVGGSGVTNTGGGTGNGLQVYPGGSIFIRINNLNLLYINGTSGDWVSYQGS